MAMLMNSNQASLEQKYNLNINYSTMNWEDLTPAVSSANASVDLAFASLTEFLTNERNINRNTKDPLVFVYPAYVFLGGAFVSCNANMPAITAADLTDIPKLQNFLLNYTFAAADKSSYDEMLFTLAKMANVNFSKVKITNIGSEDGLLAAINGSVDATSAGLTQRNEAIQKGCRVVLDSKDLKSIDIAGFVVKQSTLAAKQSEIEDFVRIWFDSINYVMSDPANNLAEPIAYLDKTSSTHYTVKTYQQALANEVFPKSIADANTIMLNKGAEFDFNAVKDSLVSFMLSNGVITEQPQNVDILNIAQ
jgi:hypothetical protein